MRHVKKNDREAGFMPIGRGVLSFDDLIRLNDGRMELVAVTDVDAADSRLTHQLLSGVAFESRDTSLRQGMPTRPPFRVAIQPYGAFPRQRFGSGRTDLF